jgi:hypothetical protein
MNSYNHAFRYAELPALSFIEGFAAANLQNAGFISEQIPDRTLAISPHLCEFLNAEMTLDCWHISSLVTHLDSPDRLS